MSQRKIWSLEEDQTLRMLREEKKIRKWSIIAKLMTDQFNHKSRTGKQCRERYHNHLDSSILRQQWSAEEENCLYSLHDLYGNKWAQISQKLPGRTDNCVKNHFYSRMRKAVRKLNKIIYQFFKRQIKQIKIQVVYKIVQAADERFKKTTSSDSKIFQLCAVLKRNLLQYSNDFSNSFQNDLQKLKELAKGIHEFNTKYRRRSKNTPISQSKQKYLKTIQVRNNGTSYESEQNQGQSDMSLSDLEECSSMSGQKKIVKTKSRKQRKKQEQMFVGMTQEQNLMKNKQFEKKKTQKIDDFLSQTIITSNKGSNLNENAMRLEQFFKREGILKIAPKIQRVPCKLQERNWRKESEEGDEESKENMLGQSIEGIKIGTFVNDADADMEDESRLFNNFIIQDSQQKKID